MRLAVAAFTFIMLAATAIAAIEIRDAINHSLEEMASTIEAAH